MCEKTEPAMLGKFIAHCEDSLTSSVITHLLHLPMEMVWQILQNACYSRSLPDYPGEPKSVDFWPNWNPEGTNNSQRVIPDAFIRFPKLDVIFESKRWDSGQQSESQWQAEITAYANEYGKEKVPVIMIALGGIWGAGDETLTPKWIDSPTHPTIGNFRPDFQCRIHMCRWSGLLLECQRMKRELETTKYPSSRTFSDMRILADLIDLFSWHGYALTRWFDDFNFRSNLLTPMSDAHHQFFRNTNLNFYSL